MSEKKNVTRKLHTIQRDLERIDSRLKNLREQKEFLLKRKKNLEFRLSCPFNEDPDCPERNEPLEQKRQISKNEGSLSETSLF